MNEDAIEAAIVAQLEAALLKIARKRDEALDLLREVWSEIDWREPVPTSLQKRIEGLLSEAGGLRAANVRAEKVEERVRELESELTLERRTRDEYAQQRDSLRALLTEARRCLNAWDDHYPIGLRARIDTALGGSTR